MKKIANLFNYITVPLWAVFVVCCVGQVVGRYLLDFPLQWTEEIARAALIWLTFLGALQLSMSNDHIEIGYLRQLGVTPLNKVIDVVKALATLITGGFLTFGGAKLLPLTVNSYAPGSGLSLVVWYLIAFGAGVLLMVIAAISILGLFFNRAS
jgi:TRAP-type C4-dicarboxylate transport system permease small subunit